VADRCFGVEVEYAIDGVQNGMPADRQMILRRLMELAHSRLVSVPDGASTGVFLENGALLSLDTGLHLEYSTPECQNPHDVCRYVEAGNETVLRLIEMFAEEHPEIETNCYRVNVDYLGSSWGVHESYQHGARPESLPENLIAHIVSRLVYSGAGGFEPDKAGLKMTLSPRAAFIEKVISPDSVEGRGIYHEKNEPLCRGNHRLHILFGESLCSHAGSFLKVGATAIIVAMAEAGAGPGAEVQLESPLDALRIVATDLSLRRALKLRGGRRMTAVEIQREYLRKAEENIDRSFMPAFAPAVCAEWRRVLDVLDEGPEAAVGILDWPTKLVLYRRHAKSRDLVWERLPFWSAVLERLCTIVPWQPEDGTFPLDSALNAEASSSTLVSRIGELLRRRGLEWDELRQVLALRPEFLELEFRFSQLGSKAIWSALETSNALRHRVKGVENIEFAMHNAPAGGRAKLRGAVVKRIAGDKQGQWSCTWQRIYSPKYARLLDLSDLFAEEEVWSDCQASETAVGL
jgi:proteasome accessory factor A